MAKVRRYKLSWKPSESEQVIGYRLYWSKDHTLDYDSNFFELGKITSVYLPDILKLDPRYNLRVMLGITAVDMNGNESDMVKLAKPYQTIAPPAPEHLLLTALDEFTVLETSPDEILDPSEEPCDDDLQTDELAELARIAEPLLKS